MNTKVRSLNLVLLGVVIGIIGLAVGLHIVGPAGTAISDGDVPAANKVWTCSMHPQIRMNRPGRCPICGMELVPVATTQDMVVGDYGGLTEHLSLSEHARQMARVETVPIEERELFKEIRTVGKVDFDETGVAHIAAWVDGRVDEVFANFPGSRQTGRPSRENLQPQPK